MLFVALACSACVATTAAFAEEEADWLVNGEFLGGPMNITITAEFLIEDLTGVALLCSAIYDGTVGAGNADLITKVLNLAGEEISSTPLMGLFLTCLGEGSLCEATEDGAAYPVGLPWASTLLLASGGAILDAAIEGSYEFACLELGITVTDECTGSTTELMENLAGGGVEGTFNGESELVTCSIGKEKSGLLEDKNTTLLTEAGTLTVS